MTNKNLQNIMVDLETLGTRADSVILSIGAVRFDLDSEEMDNDAFYASISIDSNHDAVQRHISEETMIWWLGRTPEAQRVFTEPKITLLAALEDFALWTGMDPEDRYNNTRIWSNGADFDIPMLTHAFDTNGIAVPWKFYNTGCFRTIKNMPKAKKVPKPVNVLAHNALQDAVAQAKHLQAMWKVLNA